MPKWLGLTSPAMSSTVSGTPPSHRDRKIKLLFPDKPLVSVRKPDLEIIGFLSRRRRHLERSPSGTRLCSQPENANFLSEMFPDRHLGANDVQRDRPATVADACRGSILRGRARRQAERILRLG